MKTPLLSLTACLAGMAVLLPGGGSSCPGAAGGEQTDNRVLRRNTFAVVAYDPGLQEWGVAVASKVLAVGAGTPWGKAGAGAIVTQAAANVTYGPRGLDLLARGKTAAEAVKLLTDADEHREDRQVGIVDAKGNTAHFTGKNCDTWAGARAGKHHVCLGNLLAGKEVVEEMSAAFEQAAGPLAWRLLAALAAGEKAGGDRRGKQSAALLVLRAKGGHLGLDDRAVDLRVDDHRQPVQELARILALAVPRQREPEKVRVRIRTDKGDIEVELEAARAPVTTVNFLRYVDGKFYDGGRFHRTVTSDNQPDSKVKIQVVQAGIDPKREKDEFPPIRLERTNRTKLRHRDGTISMARDGPDTATSDFFLCVGDQPELDFGGKRNPDGQGFAAFGRVVKGMDVVRAIQKEPADKQNLSPPITIRKVERVLMGKPGG